MPESLPSMHEALGSSSSTSNPCTEEVESEGSEVRGHPQRHSKLSYMNPCSRRREPEEGISS